MSPSSVEQSWRKKRVRGGAPEGRNVLQTVSRTLYRDTSRAARDTVQAYNSLIKQSS